MDKYTPVYRCFMQSILQTRAALFVAALVLNCHHYPIFRSPF